MKLSDWAKEQGISYRTAWRWFKAGQLPIKAKQLPTGTIILELEKTYAFTGGGGRAKI